MNPTRVDTLKVPGASLYHEVWGSGPVLLMIAGGPADAAVFAGIAGPLADRYTVVTYDPRGNSRSSLDGPPEDQRVEVHSDDARRLLAAVATEPAFVLGSSGGAPVGLELTARHPEQVHTLVAHEPPVFELLPDAAPVGRVLPGRVRHLPQGRRRPSDTEVRCGRGPGGRLAAR